MKPFCVWSEMLILYLRNSKLHKICLTPHIMWFRVNMFLPFSFRFEKSFTSFGPSEQSSARPFVCSPDELFRYLFVIWFFIARKVISIELSL